MSKIFISYSHKDEEWKDKLVEHLQVLELEGYCTLWDDRKIEVGDDWFPEIEKALQEAGIAVMLISVHFLTSNFIQEEEMPRILERRRKEGLRVIPIIVEPCPWKKVEWLASIQLLPKNGKPLSTRKRHTINTILAKLAEDIAALIKPKIKKEPEKRFLSLPPEKVSISKLPTTGPKLFGREKELERLDAAWKDEHTCLVTLIAWGGVGKTALVNHWLNMMAKNNYRGARKVYGWSFYSQGAEEGKQASADEFLYETLKWFGDPQPEEGTSVEKGRRLARLVGKEKTLLILDGMEPLQYPPGEVHGLDGKLKDQGLREAGTYDHLPRGLLGLAECYRRQKQFSRAWDDLNEVLEIAQLGSMKLFLVDYHLEAGRLCEAEGKKQEAKDHFTTAAKMIEETGYHRRDGEVRQ